MRYLYLVKCPENHEPPPQALMEAMEKSQEEGTRDGWLISWGGLGDSAEGARVRLTGGNVKVIDGPFTEAKELIGGWAVLEHGSKEEAVASGVWLMELHREHWPGWEGEVEVRPLLGDLGG